MNETPIPASRVIEECVPGKQVTIAHVIAVPCAGNLNAWASKAREPWASLSLTQPAAADIAAERVGSVEIVSIGSPVRW